MIIKLAMLFKSNGNPPQCESTLTLVSNMFLDCNYADLCALNLQNK